MENIANDVLWGEVPSERKQANERAAQAKGLESCEVCGRGVREGNGWMVEVVAGGSEICEYGTGDDQDPGYMGAWLLGPECGKKVPAAYRQRA